MLNRNLEVPSLQEASGPTIVLASELFPPAIGGTATLFWNTYTRVTTCSTVVLTDGQAAAQTECDGRLEIHRSPGRPATWSPFSKAGLSYYLRRARELRRLCRGRYAVVHCGRALPEGGAALLARATGGAPYVCWVHGEELAYMRMSRELRALGLLVYRGAAGIIANSSNSTETLRAFGFLPSRSCVAYPGVDGARFSPSVDGSGVRRRYASPEEFLLLSVGRLQKRKGQDLVIEALAMLAKNGRRPRYVVVGDGDERRPLEELARARGVGDLVTFAGKVPEAELAAHYAACDIFVLPNREDAGDFEGFGIVFVEAAAAGKPTVAGDSGGAPEAVEDGVTGRIVDGTDVEALARVLEQLMEDQGLRRRFGVAGRQRALTHFSWESTVAAVGHLHTEVASEAFRMG